ncbi:ribose-5-phosphate isomerase [Natronoglycomyces albus]|uniref:Ribose-5-phosphate isomerase B n=1 Tax=Natronoglycomyces albus TaxID=2811108 RepID=A0A895XXC5_9ACTN|nr:ribose-5-phosphate isomerase [Natronoglycomyces albus]QSB06278.1 ribose-5-phosphate isomerase [Natronoglycomyces albus]
MRIYIGSDHAGYELKGEIAQHLRDNGHDVTDIGPAEYDAADDYPAFCLHTGAATVSDPGSLGIVLGGSGNGEQIAANKVPGVRAVLAWSVETAKLGREHNDANVLSIGARMHPKDEALAIVDAFVSEPFSGGERHQRRIQQMLDYEKGRQLPKLP